MAITIPVDSDESISLEEFVSDVERTLDRNDPETLLALAPRLRRLGNNRRFLVDFLNEQITTDDQFQNGSLYTPQVLELATRPGFLVRANVWEPPKVSEQDPEGRDRLFMYLQPHDHNFSFLTVGYYGAGYQTTIYECDPDSVTGIPGDRVDMTFLETTTLPQGKVMMYRATRDIHCQEHPTEYSISLNLLVRDDHQAWREQYYYDFAGKTIVTAMKAVPGHPRLTCYLARLLGDDSTRTKLDAIRASNPVPQVRLTAIDSLAALCPDEAVALWISALGDRHPLVRDAARVALAQLERGAPVDLAALLA
jgi:hypothetical protein